MFLEVLNPVAQLRGSLQARAVSPRPATLDGKTVGLLASGRTNSDVVLKRVAENLRRRYPRAGANFYMEHKQPWPKGLIEKIAAECDVAIIATADCGGCCPRSIRGAVQLEDMGKPAVTIVSEGFGNTAAATARAAGLPNLQYVIVPWIYRTLDQDRVIRQTDDATEALVRELTTTRADAARSRVPAAATREKFEGADRLDAAERMNHEYLDRDWGDGYPMIAPTPEAVERMLEAARLSPDEVICDLPPGYGVATAEKVAINAVMAGAAPPHMPVIVAALKALAKMNRDKVHSFIASTSANASLLLINGPVAKQLGINDKCALGPGKANRVNILIGRAYTLCLKNIGHWYPGQFANASIGSMRRFTGCVAEHEDVSPWDPFHVEHGFKREDSVVTVLGAKGELDVIEHGNNTAKGMLRTIAYSCVFSEWDRAMRNPNSDFETIVFFPPDVARVLKEDGMSKQAAKRFLHENATNSIRRMAHCHPFRATHIAPEWRYLMDLSEQELENLWQPVRTAPERYHLICVGADRAKSLVMSSHYSTPSSEKIDLGKL